MESQTEHDLVEAHAVLADLCMAHNKDTPLREAARRLKAQEDRLLRFRISESMSADVETTAKRMYRLKSPCRDAGLIIIISFNVL